MVIFEQETSAQIGERLTCAKCLCDRSVGRTFEVVCTKYARNLNIFVMNFIISPKKWSGQNGTSRTGSYTYVWGSHFRQLDSNRFTSCRKYRWELEILLVSWGSMSPDPPNLLTPTYAYAYPSSQWPHQSKIAGSRPVSYANQYPPPFFIFMWGHAEPRNEATNNNNGSRTPLPTAKWYTFISHICVCITVSLNRKKKAMLSINNLYHIARHLICKPWQLEFSLSCTVFPVQC